MRPRRADSRDPGEVVLTLTRDSHVAVCSTLAQRADLGLGLQLYLAGDPLIKVRKAIVLTQNLNLQVIAVLLSARSCWVLKALREQLDDQGRDWAVRRSQAIANGPDHGVAFLHGDAGCRLGTSRARLLYLVFSKPTMRRPRSRMSLSAAAMFSLIPVWNRSNSPVCHLGTCSLGVYTVTFISRSSI